MERVVGAGPGVEEDLETVCGQLELLWDLRRCEGDDVQQLVVVDEVHHRSRQRHWTCYGKRRVSGHATRAGART